MHVIVHKGHLVLEPEKVARNLLGRVAHKIRAEGAVLGQLMGDPAYEILHVDNEPEQKTAVVPKCPSLSLPFARGARYEFKFFMT